MLKRLEELLERAVVAYEKQVEFNTSTCEGNCTCTPEVPEEPKKKVFTPKVDGDIKYRFPEKARYSASDRLLAEKLLDNLRIVHTDRDSTKDKVLRYHAAIEQPVMQQDLAEAKANEAEIEDIVETGVPNLDTPEVPTPKVPEVKIPNKVIVPEVMPTKEELIETLVVYASKYGQKKAEALFKRHSEGAENVSALDPNLYGVMLEALKEEMA